MARKNSEYRWVEQSESDTLREAKKLTVRINQDGIDCEIRETKKKTWKVFSKEIRGSTIKVSQDGRRWAYMGKGYINPCEIKEVEDDIEGNRVKERKLPKCHSCGRPSTKLVHIPYGNEKNVIETVPACNNSSCPLGKLKAEKCFICGKKASILKVGTDYDGKFTVEVCSSCDK